MKPGAGKSKGNRFEGLVARRLSLWLTRRKDSTQLIPSRLSGGWKDKGWRQAGDLAPNGDAGEEFRRQFVVECKHHKTDLLWALFRTEGENIQGWWKKLCLESKPLGLLPMLVFRQNGRPIVVGLPTQLVDLVGPMQRGNVLDYQEYARTNLSPVGPMSLVLFSTLLKIPPKQLYRWIPRDGEEWRT